MARGFRGGRGSKAHLTYALNQFAARSPQQRKAMVDDVRSKFPRNGDVRYSDQIDFAGDLFKRSHESHPGWYVKFGMWKGPFQSAEDAKEAYREWAWEAKHS